MMDYLANIMARRLFEDELEKRISAKMEENHQDYIFDIKKQILKEESSLKESSQSLAKLKQLEDKNKIHLTKSIMELLRPENLSEIIGQERAIKAFKSKIKLTLSSTSNTLWPSWRRKNNCCKARTSRSMYSATYTI